MRFRTTIPAVLGIGALGALLYGAGYERTRWTLRRADVPVLVPDAEPLRVLHLSDLHLTKRQRSKQEWVRGLAALDPDLVVLTGDLLGASDAISSVMESLEPLFDYPGVFTFGNSDYFGPVLKSPLDYVGNNDRRKLGDQMPSAQLAAALAETSWRNLNNRRTTVTAGGRTIEVVGVDDPHLGRDDYDQVGAPADPTADVHLALLHSPEPPLIDAFASDGFDLVLAGHTHGGQVRLPGYGAFVTNCGIDTGRAQGLHRWAGDTWLHVSAGLGTSPLAPIRFACPPEVTILTLVPAPESRDPATSTSTRRRSGVS